MYYGGGLVAADLRFWMLAGWRACEEVRLELLELRPRGQVKVVTQYAQFK